MRIGYISDLHIDINEGYPVIDALKEICIKKEINILLVGGDTFNSCKKTCDFFYWFEKETGIKVCFIFGNHEYYYNENKMIEYREKQNIYPFKLSKQFSLIADTGWYDYSWATEGSYGQILKGKVPNGGTWPDHRLIKWPDEIREDPAHWFTRTNIESFEKQNNIIDEQNIEKSKKIIMMHMVPQHFLLQKDPHYIYTNAFFGSKPNSDFVNKVKPKICFFGHTHFANDITADETRYICRPLGYYFEWGNSSVYEVLEKMFFVMEIKEKE